MSRFGEVEFDFQEGQGFVATGQVMNLIRNHLARGNLKDAADLYSKCKEDFGDDLIADFRSSSSVVRDNLAQMFMLSRDYKRASTVYLDSGNVLKAAELAEMNYDLSGAADLFMQAGDSNRAAALYEKNLEFEKAARLFIEIKDYSRAADNLERGERFMDAAKIFLKLRLLPRAVDVLQKVGPNNPEYIQATLLLGDILSKAGQGSMALKRYAAVVKTMPCAEANMEIYHRLALGLAEMDMLDKAAQVMMRVALISPGYKDAKALAEAYKSGKKSLAPVAAGVDVTGELAPENVFGDAFAPPPMQPAAQSEARPFSGEFAALGGPGGVVSMMDGFEYLKQLEIFQELSLDDMKKFYNLCEEVTYTPGQILIEQGRPGEALYIVKKGEVDIFKVNPDGSSIKLTTLPTGVCVGEMSMIEDEPTSARVAAKSHVSVLRVGKQKFNSFLYSNDHIALRVYKAFVKGLSKRLREANKKAAG